MASSSSSSSSRTFHSVDIGHPSLTASPPLLPQVTNPMQRDDPPITPNGPALHRPRRRKACFRDPPASPAGRPGSSWPGAAGCAGSWCALPRRRRPVARVSSATSAIARIGVPLTGEFVVRWCRARRRVVRVAGPVFCRCRPIGGGVRRTGGASRPLRGGLWPSPPGATRRGRGLAPMRPSLAARTLRPRACTPRPSQGPRDRPAAALSLRARRLAAHGVPLPEAHGLRCPYQPIRRQSPSTNQPTRHVRLLPSTLFFQPTPTDTYLTRHFPMDCHGVAEARDPAPGARRDRTPVKRALAFVASG
ncbi:hypothetical protein SAMN06265355_11159 [Actinomadura mexicana]|uniref:Uncharacterized protein n=1 Tax=Actinomadura mexicana TaxID=134959 RepID=A0A239BRT9_9ACTN|nr:hypothetical protein SAMN06265355_11159 [Actinomadura mexicana]